MLLQGVYQSILAYLPLWLLLLVTCYLIKTKYSKGLNKYPGPLLASFTNWWRFFDVRAKRAEHTQIRLHRQHGDIVRLGPNVLSFADPKAIKDIYGLNKGFVKASH